MKIDKTFLTLSPEIFTGLYSCNAKCVNYASLQNYLSVHSNIPPLPLRIVFTENQIPNLPIHVSLENAFCVLFDLGLILSTFHNFLWLFKVKYTLVSLRREMAW